MSTGKLLGLTREDAEAKLSQLQAHYAESALDAIRSIGHYLVSLEERVAAVTPANAPANLAYRYGALAHDIKMARYSAAACVVAIEREAALAKCTGLRDPKQPCAICDDKDEPVL